MREAGRQPGLADPALAGADRDDAAHGILSPAPQASAHFSDRSTPGLAAHQQAGQSGRAQRAEPAPDGRPDARLRQGEAGVRGRQHAAEPPGDVQLGREQPAAAERREGLRHIRAVRAAGARIEHQDRQRATGLQRLGQPAEIGRAERIDARAVDQGQLGSGVADQPLEAPRLRRRLGLELERREQGAQLLDAAGARYVRAQHRDRPALEHGAGGKLGDRCRLARAGRTAEQQSGRLRQGREAVELVQGVTERRDRVGRAQLAHRGEQAIAHAGRQLVMRGHPRQPLLTRRRLGRGEQSAEIDLIVRDGAGDAHPAVHLLGGHDDRIGAQERAQPGHRLRGRRAR